MTGDVLVQVWMVHVPVPVPVPVPILFLILILLVQVWMVSSEESSVVRLAQSYRRSLAAQQPPQISVVEALDGAEVTLFFYSVADTGIEFFHFGSRILIFYPSLAAQQPPQISVVEALDGAEVTLFFLQCCGYRIRIFPFRIPDPDFLPIPGCPAAAPDLCSGGPRQSRGNTLFFAMLRIRIFSIPDPDFFTHPWPPSSTILSSSSSLSHTQLPFCPSSPSNPCYHFVLLPPQISVVEALDGAEVTLFFLQCCGSGMLIPNTGFEFFHFGSRDPNFFTHSGPPSSRPRSLWWRPSTEQR